MKYLVLIGLLALGACTTAAPDADDIKDFTPISFAGQKATVDERASCEAAGGTVERVGRMGVEHCIQPYPDAGEVCDSKADCLGRCEYGVDVSDPVPGAPADGVCQATTKGFGCVTLVENGMIERTICID